MYRQPVLLAAVDPFHAHAKPLDLDARLLDAAAKFARLLHGTTHIFHAYMPLIAIQPAMVSSASVVALPPEVEEVHGRQITRAIDQLAERAGIPRRRCHIHMGDVAGEMCAQSRRMRADLVVMGVVSRSALARVFIGNTAERVLDRLNCDVLVVKPRSFTANATRPSMRKSGRTKRTEAPASRSEHDVVPPLL
jgi:universal stress protein E